MNPYDRIKEDRVTVPKYYRLPKNLPELEWVSAPVQSSYIGASQSPGLFGVGYEGDSPLSLYERLVHPETAPCMDSDSEHLVIGQLLEKPIAQMYAEKNDCQLWYNSRRIWRHKQYPFIAATLDFVCWDLKRIVETKNVSVFAADEWDGDEAPLKFQIQAQQQMACTGMQEVHLVGLVGGNKIEVRPIKRNERFIRALIERLCKFWVENVLAKVPPDPTIPADLEVIGRLHPDDNGKAVRLDMDESLLRRWQKATKIRLACEKIEKLAKAQVAAQLQKYTFGVCGDFVVKYKTQEKSGYHVKPSKTRVAGFIKGLPKGTEIEDGDTDSVNESDGPGLAGADEAADQGGATGDGEAGSVHAGGVDHHAEQS